jgi:hypothetical protein
MPTPTRSVALSFTDSQGVVLKSETVSLKPGESRFLDLNADADLHTEATCNAIHALAVVPVTGPVDEPTARGTMPVLPTLELVDNRSGQTTILVEGTLVRPIVQIARDNPVAQ